ncbi:MAG: hypothetical protein U5N26_07015 [Candidatus Marinimicrobia bacterium]|nr:hypothetical protein [Candidatus Neomarinimicrobiota bacterium]
MSAVKVHLYDDSSLKHSIDVSGGSWSKSAVSLAAGEHILKARAEDQAGNISGYSSVKRIITGTNAKPTVDLIDDTGQSSTDNVTNDDSFGLKVHLNIPVPAGASAVSSNSVSAIKLYKKTGTSTYDLAATLSASLADPTTGEWESEVFNEQGPPDGTHEYCAAWVDAQGNESDKGSLLSVVLDTQAPDLPSIDNISDGQVFVGTAIDVSGSAT